MSLARIKLPIAILIGILGLYALAEISGYGIRSRPPEKKADQPPLLTCSMAFGEEGQTRKALSAKHHPEIIIRNQGPRKAVSVSWTANVYRYDAMKKAVTAFAIQDPRQLGPTDYQEELPPAEALRQATMGLPGDHIVAVYSIRVNYRIETSQAPSQIDAVFFVANGTIYDDTQFQADQRYDAIKQAIHAFDRSLAPPPSTNEQTLPSTDAARPPQLAMQVYGVYRSGGAGVLLPITNGTKMHSGDHYKLYFRTNRDCYAYIYQIDAKGAIFQLFPLDRFDGVALNQANPVTAGVNYMLPSRNRYFYLDDTTGEETLYFAIYPQRNVELEARYKALQAALQSTASSQILAAQERLAAYLDNGVVDKQAQMIISPVSWKSDQPTAPVLGYQIRDIEKARVHKIGFTHRKPSE